MSRNARIAIESIDQRESLEMVAELDAHLEPLYPPESRHGLTTGAWAMPGAIRSARTVPIL
ncbi:MAG TPA: hypothetical protein VH040_10570 [Usitatibacter sp.]|nr:hypothetical protein [Usitatibacter sp.]